MDGEDQKFWVDGEPYPFLASPDDTTGETQKFWVDGQPFEFLAESPVPDTTAMFMMFF